MKKAIGFIALIIISAICGKVQQSLLAQATSKQEDQATTKANAMFDAMVKQAEDITKNVCYGEFIRVILPPKNATREAVVVVNGITIKHGEEDDYGILGTEKSVVFVRKPRTMMVYKGNLSMKTINERQTSDFACQ